MRPKTIAWYMLLAAIVVFVLMVCLSSAGCVSWRYDAVTHAVTYNRLGNMQVQDVEILLPNGVTVRIGKSNSESKLAEAAVNIAAAARNISEVAR